MGNDRLSSLVSVRKRTLFHYNGARAKVSHLREKDVRAGKGKKKSRRGLQSGNREARRCQEIMKDIQLWFGASTRPTRETSSGQKRRGTGKEAAGYDQGPVHIGYLYQQLLPNPSKNKRDQMLTF